MTPPNPQSPTPEDLPPQIERYFAEVSDEQLQADLKKAGFDFYNKIGRVIDTTPSPTLQSAAEGAAK